jgi:MFS family permease
MTILLGCVAAVIGSAIQASAYSTAQLCVGRACTGFAIGCISSAVPTYLNETGMEIDDRGPANALNAIFLISGGKLISFLYNPPLTYDSSPRLLDRLWFYTYV